MADEVVDYWKNLGIVKEVHDSDVPENAWASYVPSAGLEEGNEEKYPVVFVWHGNTNSIWVTETYGFAQLGAQEGYITIIPEASNGDNAIEEFDRIMTYLKEQNYPIDESRVYCCGFSKGGYVVQNLANAYPTRIAGITAGGNIAHTPDGHEEWITFTDEQIAALGETEMPFMDYSGTFDSNNYPLNVASHMDQPEEKIEGFNLWLNATGAVGDELTLEESQNLTENSDDIVKQLIGIDFTDTEIRELDDTNYYIGTFQNEAGATVYEWVTIEGQMHWPAPSMPELCWEFLSAFSRNVETGELIY
jgi:poly(3-hydroxybutyrate) depolymerase